MLRQHERQVLTLSPVLFLSETGFKLADKTFLTSLIPFIGSFINNSCQSTVFP